MWIDINGDARLYGGRSFPPVEELFDHFRNEDGVGWDVRSR